MSEGYHPSLISINLWKQPNVALVAQPPDPEDTAIWLSAVDVLNGKPMSIPCDLIHQAMGE